MSFKEVKSRRSLGGKAVFLLFALLAFFIVFLVGYDFGQKGKAIGFWFGPKSVTNTEVGQPSGVDFSTYWEAWNQLMDKSIYSPAAKNMLYGSISGMLSSVNDPYTVFFTPDENKAFKDDIGGSFDGIGLELISKNNVPTVVAPLSGSPSEKAGLKAGDVIIEVDGVKTDTIGFNDVVNKIRGQKGTTVNLKVSRDGSTDLLNFDVVRDTITVKSVTSNTQTVNGKKYSIVKISQFGDDTDNLFAQYAAQVLKDKPDGIIVDLRNNPGGYLQTAVDLSSYFVDGGVVVSEQDKNGQKTEYKTTKPAILKDYKTVVLVNGGSASASEIFSGALQDRKVGELIGEKTFGKGSVQELVDLPDGSAVKITIAKWYTPNGRGINGAGITPDITVAEGDLAKGDDQMNRALGYLQTGK